MATVFLVEPARKRVTPAERDFAEELAAIRLALGGLEAACTEDPSRCRRAAATLQRMMPELQTLAAHDDYDGAF